MSSADTASVLVLRGPRLPDGRTVDVRLAAGRIAAVGTPGSLTPAGTAPAAVTVDLSGYLLLPAPAEPHAHHDTALTAPGAGPPAAQVTGPPADDPACLQRRITEAALLQLGHGATAQRSHIGIGDLAGLTALQAALRARRALLGLTDLSVAPVPRLLTGRAGADGRALLRDAAKMGAATLGGAPDLDPDPAGYLDELLRTADEYGCALDLHTEGDDPGRLTRLASAAAGLRAGVALGPCTGLARMPAGTAARTAERLAAAGVTVVALPQSPCALLPGDVPRGTTPVRLLRAAGVAVAAGSGALRDAANPVGRGDPLEAAYLLSSAGQTSPEEAYAAVSTHARAALGLPPLRIEAGFPAELLAVRGTDLPGALSLAYSRVVIHRGRIVSRTSAVREFCGAAPPPDTPGLPRQSPR
ncbi:amidohydrolase family protein [Streptomyces sp. YIM 98790]|uniref:amidohydrolase family protein n=1 Tax=Streptomyces sp. YIM 98790 TaxID=2689077 RepID=UPI00140A1D76|nr:amidohydrolase family protein [Streptomyces sp. YIM 98790]